MSKDGLIPNRKSSNATQSQDSLTKYSRPYQLEENKSMESQSIHLEKVLPLEESMESLLQRLKEAQATSFQNRMNLMYELNKEKKILEEKPNIPKQDDLIHFFTNNGELKTLNEENLDDLEREMKKKPLEINPFVEEEVALEEKAFSKCKNAIPVMEVKSSSMKDERKVLVTFPKVPEKLEKLEGWLKKKSPHMVQGWQTRFCRLAERKFFYFKKNDLENPNGVLEFDIVSVRLSEVKENGVLKGFILQPADCSKMFIFKRHEKREENGPKIEAWYDALKLHIAKSWGASKNMVHLAKIPRFWRDMRISEGRFKTKADTLDVLLFRGKSMASKFQRSFTGSHYDHVALILRYGNNELVLLEATGKEGVGLCSWNCFMRNKWHLLYKKLILRHLEMQRTDKMIETLEKFVKQVIGKKFSVNLRKLLKKKSENLDLDCAKTFEDKTFFCSELVASAYKVLGILPESLAASQYYPGHFSKEKKLALLNGAKLNEEYLIDFSLS